MHRAIAFNTIWDVVDTSFTIKITAFARLPITLVENFLCPVRRVIANRA